MENRKNRFVSAFFAAFVLAFPVSAYAVPWPLISGGIWLISNAAAMFALVFWVIAVSATAFWNGLTVFRHARPVQFRIAVGMASVVLVAMGTYAFWSHSRSEVSPYDELREILADRTKTESRNDSDVPLAQIAESLQISSGAVKFPDSELEEEIAYSIGRNNNVVWNRYLSIGKIPTDENTFAKLKSGEYEVPLGSLFKNGKLSDEFRIIDLRTALEFRTSARFRTAENVEYRAIVNDEFVPERSKPLLFICHDWAADLSRSLIATIYLRSKGYQAYALKTWMRPILDRLSIPPATYSKKVDFKTYSPSRAPKDEAFVDVLWALGETLGKRGYPSGIEIVDFPFYKLDQREYSAAMERVYERAKKGENLRFACYDTFSCFYARVFIESHDGEGTVGMGIFR